MNTRMETFYRTLKLEIENDRKILDFVMNKLKEKRITFSLLPFVDEETSTQYNDVTKTTQSTTSYSDAILITLTKTENWENKAFSKEELSFINTLTEFIEEEKFNEDKENYEQILNEINTIWIYRKRNNWFLWLVIWWILLNVFMFLFYHSIPSFWEPVGYLEFFASFDYTTLLESHKLFSFWLLIVAIIFLFSVIEFFSFTTYTLEDKDKLKETLNLIKDYDNM